MVHKEDLFLAIHFSTHLTHLKQVENHHSTLDDFDRKSKTFYHD